LPVLSQLQHQDEFARGSARVSFYRPVDLLSAGPARQWDGIGPTVVDYEGDEELAVHLPASYLDNAIAAVSKREARKLLEKVESFVTQVQSEWQQEPLRAKNNVVPLVPEWALYLPDAVLSVEFRGSHASRLFGVIASFEPRRRTFVVMEPAYWALWDWMVERMRDSPVVIETAINNLSRQCAYYRAHGTKTTDMGGAPYEVLLADAKS
jgi:hypothetical protein